MQDWQRRLAYAAFALGFLVVLFFLSRVNFLLFHSLVELFSIIVACGIFVIAWQSRDLMKNNYLLFLGVAYLFVAGIDVFHALAYKGMGVFEDSKSSDLAVQLWIAARYMQAVTILVAPYFIIRKLPRGPVVAAYALTTALLLASIFYWKVFPVGFVPGAGLTPFKINSEYVISVMMLIGMASLFRYRERFDSGILRLIVLSIALTIGAELAFTFYVSVFGLSNVIGHFFKVAAFYLIFVAVVRKGVREPYSLIFRDLKRSQERLARRSGELAQSRHEAHEARLRAETANRAKSEFLASMSHELRTPLNSVIGFAEVLQDEYFGKLSEKQREYATNIQDAGRHLLSLINDVLDLSKVEAGKMELDTTRFALGPTVENTLKLFRQKALNQNISLGLDIVPVADVELVADERKLKQILFNLISNAIKFTPDGGRVSLWARHVSETGGKGQAVEMSVTDTGPGIRPEEMQRLFQPFSQLQSPDGAHEVVGTGLGLVLTKRMVELHGGRIWMSSEQGCGCTFTFTLPLGRVNATAAAGST